MTPVPLYLMSPPRRDWALRGRANFKSRHAAAVDASLAREEWSHLADQIVAAGGEVVVLPPGEKNLTGLLYTAEAGEYYRDSSSQGRYLLPSMAAPHRQQEAEHIKSFVEEKLRLPTTRVQSVWEAQGDAIRIDENRIIHTYGLGPEGRTTKEAYREVAKLLSEEHLHLQFKAKPWFHGNTFLQIFRGLGSRKDKKVMLLCPDALGEGEYERLRDFIVPLQIEVVEITVEESEGYDTNALQVNNSVLAPESFSENARRAAESLDLTVQTLPLGELFSKGGGAPVCLTNRLWGLALEEIPGAHRWSLHPEIEAHTSF